MNLERCGRVAASVAALLCFASAAQGGSGFVVVVHPENPVESLGVEELSAIYRGKLDEWDDGTTIVPVDQPTRSASHRRFCRNVHGKSPDAIRAFWERQIFTGRGVPPAVKASDLEVLAHVRANPGAIGYVSPSASVDGVRVVAVETGR